LWAFNEEAVARAVLDSRLPVVSGVGHETDFTICDFVADARAPTPTAAAALVAPDRSELRGQLSALVARWRRVVERSLERRAQQLDVASRRLVHPAARLAQQGESLARALVRWQRGAAQRMAVLAQRLAALESGLRHLSPQRVLERGYSIVTTPTGVVVQDVRQIGAGDAVELRLARGRAGATITRTERDE
jgi:exodeoxyribonuclease VII large subunit